MPPNSVYAVTVSEEERLWLSRILMDNDQEEALEFVRTIVHRQIESYRNGQLQSHLD